MELIERLLACGTATLKAVPRVNRGGCGVYAAQVAMALYDLGITSWGVISGPPGDIELARRNNAKFLTIKDLDTNNIDMSHVLVQFEYMGAVWTHDTDITSNQKFYNLTTGYLTVPELVAISTERQGWNTEFPRWRGLRAIRSTVRTHILQEKPRSFIRSITDITQTKIGLSVDSYRRAA